MKAIRQCVLLAALIIAAAPQSGLACATCFGKSDSDLAKAMNWGILSLLAVVVVVLGGIAAFFIYLARRAAPCLPRKAGPRERAALHPGDSPDGVAGSRPGRPLERPR